MAEAPDVELVRACFDAMKADTTLSAIFGTAFFDRVPEPQKGGTKPDDYISLGSTSSIPDDVDCSEGQEITVQFDVWSTGINEAYSSARCRRGADALKRCLHNAELTLTDNALVTLTWSLTATSRDPNGITSHAAVQFTATVETP